MVAIIYKLHEDGETLFIKEIRLTSGGTLPIKDQDGFTVAEFDTNGNLKMKGNVRRV